MHKTHHSLENFRGASGPCHYVLYTANNSRGKLSRLAKKPRKPRKFSPSKVLPYTVYHCCVALFKSEQLTIITKAISIVDAVGSFDPSTTQWVSYLEQIEEFFLANDIKKKEGGNFTKYGEWISLIWSHSRN